MFTRLLITLVVLISADRTYAAYENQRPLATGTDSVTVGASVLPTGSATSALQTSGNSLLTSIASSVGGTLSTSIVGTVPVSGTFWQTTQPVSGTFWQTTQPVSIASPVAVTGDFYPVTQPISASALPLPSGAATEATLSTLSSKVPALGQAVMASSQPVTISSDQPPIPIAAPDLIVVGAAAQTTLGNNALLESAGTGAIDVSGYRSASVQVVSTGTAGTYIFENSNDGTNFTTMTVYNSSLVTGTPIIAAITATATSLIYTFPIRARYIRLRIATAITGGSIRPYSRFSRESWSPAVYQVAQTTGANLVTTGTTTATLGAGTALAGDVGVQYRANATGAALRTHIVCGASTNATLVKASAGRVLGFTFYNNSASWRYLKFHNLTTAPTVGSTPVVHTIGLPAGQAIDFNMEGGMGHATGISVSITGAAADADTTVTATDCGADIIYQ